MILRTALKPHLERQVLQQRLFLPIHRPENEVALHQMPLYLKEAKMDGLDTRILMQNVQVHCLCRLQV
jgi:hypothetical protein